MKASDVSSHVHRGLDKKKKLFKVKGTGGAGFNTAWGGSKNNVYPDLKLLENQLFYVNLTERIGNNTWYRGMLNDKQTWIHSSFVEDITEAYEEQSTSRLGHIKDGSLIYTSPLDTAASKPAREYQNSVYYIKKQAKFKGQLFYLLSNRASATNGVIGWMKASDVSSHTHAGVDKKTKTFYVKGTGGAGFDTAWGGSKNSVYADLKPLKSSVFQVNLTEKVGGNTWYRGILQGKSTWIHSSYVADTK